MSKERLAGGLVGVGARKGVGAELRHVNFIPAQWGDGVDFFFFSRKSQFTSHEPLAEMTKECILPQKEK